MDSGFPEAFANILMPRKMGKSLAARVIEQTGFSLNYYELLTNRIGRIKVTISSVLQANENPDLTDLEASLAKAEVDFEVQMMLSGEEGLKAMITEDGLMLRDRVLNATPVDLRALGLDRNDILRRTGGVK